MLQPAPLAAGLAAAAAIAMLLTALPQQPVPPTLDSSIAESQASEFAALQEIADAELLSTAADQPDAFSDIELVSMIGF